MSKWVEVALDDCLVQYRNTVFVQDDEEYGQITISKNNTVSFRGSKIGNKIGRKRQFLIDLDKYPCTLIFTRQGVSEGSIGFAPQEVNGCIATENMPMFAVNQDLIDRDLLNFILHSTAFKKKVSGLEATGSAQKAVHERDLLKLKITIPKAINDQKILSQRISNLLNYHNRLLFELERQSTYLKKLRQSILQEAIEGKLTADWRADNPVIKGDPNTDAYALLEEIQAEKKRLTVEGRLKKEKPLAPISDAEKPFELPEGWVWVKLGHIASLGTGATPLTSNAEYYINGTVNWVTSSVTANDFVDKVEKKITEKALNETNCKIYPVGTLLVAMYGEGKTRGQITELRVASSTNQAIAAVLLHLPFINHRSYVKNYFKKIYLEIRELASGGAQPNLNMEKVKHTLIPMPPLGEQTAIVEKVQYLLAQVDTLESELKNRQVQTEQLMQAVLAEAFSPSL